jgi:Helix-turn-helix of insertion element transposase
MKRREMIERKHTLRGKKEKAIIALLNNPTVKSAAAEARIADVTLFRWLRDEQFKAAYREARRRIMETALNHLQSACAEAVEVVRFTLQNATTPPGQRLQAAKMILETAMRFAETEDLEARIEALERILNETGKSN